MRRWILGLVVLVTLPLVGCGYGGADSSEPQVGSSGPAAGYPLTLPQLGGELRLDEAPERVYVVDEWSLDIVVGLGVTPVGAALYFDPQVWVAANPAMAGVEVTKVTDALPLEQIAAAQPDLIVDLGGNSTAEPGLPDKLRRIAPVLYPPKDQLTDTWRDRIRHAGQVLGRPDIAETILGQADQTLADIRADHPQLTGAPLTFARFDPPASFALVVDRSDWTRRFLDTELGFTTPAAQTEAYASGRFDKVGGNAEGISLEHGDLIDADAAAAMIWFQDDTNLEALRRQPAWRRIPVVAEDRVVPMDINAAIAFRTPTPASIAWAADSLIPQVAAAVQQAGRP